MKTHENFHVNSGIMSSKYKMTDISQENLQEVKQLNPHHTAGPSSFAAANTPLEKLKNSEATGTYLPGIYNQ